MGCGQAGGGGQIVGPALPIYPGAPGEQVGYAVIGTGASHPTPYPVVCAERPGGPPANAVVVTIGNGPPTIHVETGQEVVVLIHEKCTFNLQFNLPLRGDADALRLIANASLASGIQGSAWLELQAIHPGQAEVGAFGGCAIPYPRPTEPAGVSLVCDSVGHGALLTIDVA